MVNNKIWANAYWNFFHGVVANFNESKLTEDNLKKYKLFIRTLVLSIPCKKCKLDTISYFERNRF